MQLSKIIWQFVEFLLNDRTKFTINYPKKKRLLYNLHPKKNLFKKKKTNRLLQMPIIKSNPRSLHATNGIQEG